MAVISCIFLASEVFHLTFREGLDKWEATFAIVIRHKVFKILYITCEVLVHYVNFPKNTLRKAKVFNYIKWLQRYKYLN